MPFPKKKRTLDYRLNRRLSELKKANKLKNGTDVVLQVEDNKLSLTLYPIGTLAKCINRTSLCIRVWENNGLMPTATFKDARGRRLYAGLQIALLVYLVDRYNVRQGATIPREFKEELAKLWKEVKLKILQPQGDATND